MTIWTEYTFNMLFTSHSDVQTQNSIKNVDNDISLFSEFEVSYENALYKFTVVIIIIIIIIIITPSPCCKQTRHKTAFQKFYCRKIKDGSCCVVLSSDKNCRIFLSHTTITAAAIVAYNSCLFLSFVKRLVVTIWRKYVLDVANELQSPEITPIIDT